MSEEERPAHYVHDVATGETEVIPVSDEEWDALKKREAEHEAEMAAAEAERADLAAQVAAHPDPLVQLLARQAGLA